MLRILHLEDDPIDGDLILQLLAEEGIEAQSDRVDRLVDFKNHLLSGRHDLILSDFTIPGLDAMEALKLAREHRPELPFIFISGTLGEERAIETLKLGASDYVLKHRLGRLGPSIKRALQEGHDQRLRQQAEAALRAVIEGIEEAIYVKDREGKYLMINSAGVRRLGQTSAQDVINKDDGWFFGPDLGAAIRAQDLQVMERNQPETFEETLTLGGCQRVFLTNKAPYLDHAGKVIGVLGISHDITERKHAEEAIRELNETLELRVQQRTEEVNEANRNLKAFTSTAAHDLRSPLRAISSFAEIALEEYGDKLDETGRSYLERISQSASQMNGLLNDLLEYSRITQAELKLEALELQEVLRQGLVMVEADAREKSARISVEARLPKVMGHPSTLVLVVANLVSNALKFVSPEVQPQVRIRAEKAQDSPVEGKEACWVRLWVEDNGIGIAAEDVGKLFEVFQRLNSKAAYPGTGLGLAMVRRAVERMGGRVGVESEVGKGSRFWLELRAAEG